MTKVEHKESNGPSEKKSKENSPKTPAEKEVQEFANIELASNMDDEKEK